MDEKDTIQKKFIKTSLLFHLSIDKIGESIYNEHVRLYVRM